MRRKGTPPGLLFRLIIPATAVFIVTIFALLAAPYGHQDAPFWKLIERHGDRLLLAEFTVVIMLTLAAMIWDRRQILKQSVAQQHDSATQASPQSESGHEAADALAPPTAEADSPAADAEDDTDRDS